MSKIHIFSGLFRSSSHNDAETAPSSRDRGTNPEKKDIEKIPLREKFRNQRKTITRRFRAEPGNAAPKKKRQVLNTEPERAAQFYRTSAGNIVTNSGDVSPLSKPVIDPLIEDLDEIPLAKESLHVFPSIPLPTDSQDDDSEGWRNLSDTSQSSGSNEKQALEKIRLAGLSSHTSYIADRTVKSPPVAVSSYLAASAPVLPTTRPREYHLTPEQRAVSDTFALSGPKAQAGTSAGALDSFATQDIGLGNRYSHNRLPDWDEEPSPDSEESSEPSLYAPDNRRNEMTISARSAQRQRLSAQRGVEYTQSTGRLGQTPPEKEIYPAPRQYGRFADLESDYTRQPSMGMQAHAKQPGHRLYGFSGETTPEALEEKKFDWPESLQKSAGYDSYEKVEAYLTVPTDSPAEEEGFAPRRGATGTRSGLSTYLSARNDSQDEWPSAAESDDSQSPGESPVNPVARESRSGGVGAGTITSREKEPLVSTFAASDRSTSARFRQQLPGMHLVIPGSSQSQPLHSYAQTAEPAPGTRRKFALQQSHYLQKSQYSPAPREDDSDEEDSIEARVRRIKARVEKSSAEDDSRYGVSVPATQLYDTAATRRNYALPAGTEEQNSLYTPGLREDDRFAFSPASESSEAETIDADVDRINSRVAQLSSESLSRQPVSASQKEMPLASPQEAGTARRPRLPEYSRYQYAALTTPFKSRGGRIDLSMAPAATLARNLHARQLPVSATPGRTDMAQTSAVSQYRRNAGDRNVKPADTTGPAVAVAMPTTKQVKIENPEQDLSDVLREMGSAIQQANDPESIFSKTGQIQTPTQYKPGSTKPPMPQRPATLELAFENAHSTLEKYSFAQPTAPAPASAAADMGLRFQRFLLAASRAEDNGDKSSREKFEKTALYKQIDSAIKLCLETVSAEFPNNIPTKERFAEAVKVFANRDKSAALSDQAQLAEFNNIIPVVAANVLASYRQLKTMTAGTEKGTMELFRDLQKLYVLLDQRKDLLDDDAE